METAHPVTDGYKYKDTISFPGAQNLYLKFDPRCSSQYDYDRVMVYAGDSPQCSKVAEYGGNTHGYGSRKVLGKGWPVDLVKVRTHMGNLITRVVGVVFPLLQIMMSLGPLIRINFMLHT